MYGKIFQQMYDGTLVVNWEALVTFQQFIVLADADGTVDMTPHAIANRTGIPLEIIERGIAILEEPDKYSRTPDEEGRRITRLDDHRPWGWNIVNHKKYKEIQDAAHVREQNRIRKQRERDRKKDVTECHAPSRDVTPVTPSHAKSRHTDTDTDTKKNICRASATGLLDLLNAKAGKSYQPVRANLDLIAARLAEYPEEALRQMVERKCREWASDERMEKYLRPATLFNATKCAQYMGERPTKATVSNLMRGSI